MPSKKNKVSSIKNKTKKPVKNSKPAAKKAVVKKQQAKPVKLKKPAKPAPAKKKIEKKVIKLKSMPTKKTASAKKNPSPKKGGAVKKKLITKPLVKKAIAPTKKNQVVKKVILPKKEVSKKITKTPLVKKVEPKKLASVEQKTTSAKVHIKETPKATSKKEEIVSKPIKSQDVFKKPEKVAQDVLAITNTIPVKERNEISPSKIASISNSITNPIRKTDSYAVKPEKEPSGKYELEFVVHSSAEMLYEFLSTPSGLSEWFCDDLNIRNGIYTFIWDDQLQQARLLKTVDLQLVRFQWVDKTDGSYFEFRIQRDDLTNDISLIITDFADSAADRESSKLLWNSQIEKLMHVIGSIF